MIDPVPATSAVVPAKPSRRRRRLLVILLVLAVIAGGIGWYSTRSTEEELFAERFRLSARAGGDSIDRARHDFAVHLKKRELAKRLAADPDPKVRLALIDCLIGKTAPAQPQRPGAPVNANRDYDSNELFAEELTLLMADADADVRLKAIERVCNLACAGVFQESLLKIARKGSDEERIVVAESLAHWSGEHARFIFIDRDDPVAVRSAAFRGAQKWGWNSFIHSTLSESLLQMVGERDPRIQMAAIEAARHNRWGGNARVWLKAIQQGETTERKRAYELWIDQLVNGEELPSMPYGTLFETADSLLNDTLDDRNTQAIGAYVLCRAALGHAKKIDAGGLIEGERAYRMNHILRALIRLPRQMKRWKISTDAVFTCWLPVDEEKGRPPARKLREFLIEQLREPLEWANTKRGIDASQLLLNDFRQAGDGLKPGERLPLGKLLDSYQLGSIDMLRKHLDDPEKTVP